MAEPARGDVPQARRASHFRPPTPSPLRCDCPHGTGRTHLGLGGAVRPSVLCGPRVSPASWEPGAVAAPGARSACGREPRPPRSPHPAPARRARALPAPRPSRLPPRSPPLLRGPSPGSAHASFCPRSARLTCQRTCTPGVRPAAADQPPPPPRALHSRGGRGFFMPGAHWVRLALRAGRGGPAAAPLCGRLPPTPRLPLSSAGAPGSRGGEVLPPRASPGALRASRRHTCLPFSAGGVYRAGQRHLCLCPAPSLRPGHGRCSRE